MNTYGLVRINDKDNPLNWYARMKFRVGDVKLPTDNILATYKAQDSVMTKIAHDSALYQSRDPTLLNLAKMDNGSYFKKIVESHKISFNQKMTEEIKNASPIDQGKEAPLIVSATDEDNESVVSAEEEGHGTTPPEEFEKIPKEMRKYGEHFTTLRKQLGTAKKAMEGAQTNVKLNPTSETAKAALTVARMKYEGVQKILKEKESELAKKKKAEPQDDAGSVASGAVATKSPPTKRASRATIKKHLGSDASPK